MHPETPREPSETKGEFLNKNHRDLFLRLRFRKVFKGVLLKTRGRFLSLRCFKGGVVEDQGVPSVLTKRGFFFEVYVFLMVCKGGVEDKGELFNKTRVLPF